MKMTKMLRQVVGVLTVGTALALTGSAARAQSSGVEGNCVAQDCSYESSQCLTDLQVKNGCRQVGYTLGAVYKYQDCLDCDGIPDSTGKCTGAIFDIQVYNKRTCLIECPKLNQNSQPVTDVNGAIVYDPIFTQTSSYTRRQSTGQTCVTSGGY